MAASRKILPPEMCMAGGGLVPDMGDVPIPGSSFDVGTGGSTTYKTAGVIPPPPPMPMSMAGLPPPAAPMAVPRGTPPSMPPTPPGAMPGLEEIMGSARQAAGSLYGQYTPDRRNELYAALLQKQNGMGNAIGSTLAGVGDAIAHGYGRDQTSFLDKTLQGQKDTTKEGLEAFDTGQKQTLGATAAGMDLQKMDPNSAISKISREAYAPLLTKLGYSADALSRMSGANVESAAKVAADYGGKEMENLYHQAQLIVEQSQQRAALGLKKEEIQSNRLKEKVEHPILSALPTAANAEADKIAGLGGSGGGGAAQTGPYGAEIQKGGTTYVWSPITQKYHPK